MAALNRSDLLDLSANWMLAARTLLADTNALAAYHAGGLALECLLKACVAKRTKAEDFPDKKFVSDAWVHDPKQLLRVTGLESLLGSAPKPVQDNWVVVKDWSIESRYDPALAPRSAAGTTLAAQFVAALDDAAHGVIPWLRSHC